MSCKIIMYNCIRGINCPSKLIGLDNVRITLFVNLICYIIFFSYTFAVYYTIH